MFESKTNIVSLNIIRETIEYYQNRRVQLRYKTVELLPPTIKLRTVRGTNYGRYSIINVEGEARTGT